jgi:crossover junction endodeoxyribonuclease RusA
VRVVVRRQVRTGGVVSTTLVFVIPADHWLSANQRMHWAPKAKRTAALRDMGDVMAHVHKVPQQGTTHVAAFIGYLKAGRADPSNAAPTVKALIDGLVDAGVWADDDSTHVIGPTYLRDPKSSTPGHYTVRLVLTPQTIPWLDTEETP